VERLARQAHAAAAMLFVVGVAVQVFLAGAALTQLGGLGDFRTHADFGYTVVGVLALAVLLTAIGARAGRRAVAATFGLLVLYVIQTALPALRSGAPLIAALHPLNAVLLFPLGGIIATRAIRAAAD